MSWSKNKSSVFTVERKLYLTDSDYAYLEKMLYIANRIHNTAVKHYKMMLNQFHSDTLFLSYFENFQKLKEKEKTIENKKELASIRKEIKEQINNIYALAKQYKLTEGDIYKFLGELRNRSYKNSINSAILQKLGSELFQSVNKCIVSTMREIHYRKFGETNSLCNKQDGVGFKYNALSNMLYFGKGLKRKARLKPIRKNDKYLREAMLNKVKFCRVIRKSFGKKYRYFVQFTMEGKPPEKERIIQNGKVGLDLGVSTVAFCNNKSADFIILANGIEKYDKLLKKYSRQAERRLRLNNLNCFNANGAAIKGKKPTVRTKGYKTAIMKLKTIYRKRSEFILLSHRTLANQIISVGNVIITEPMDYKALHKRVKETQRSDKPSTVKGKTVYKFKRKKRFGSSIGRRAPSKFKNILSDKAIQSGGELIKVNSTKYKASQYNHITQEATKSLLGDRIKEIDNYLVQRDLYSSFLLYNMADTSNIDFDKCHANFNTFLILQQNVVEKIKVQGDSTKNFGIKHFI